MKRYIFLVLFFILFVNTLIDMESDTANDTMDEMYRSYRNTCKNIDAYQEKKLQKFMKESTANNNDEQHLDIVCRFKELHEKIENLETNYLQAIKTEFLISDELWEETFTIIKKVQDFEENNKHIPLLNVTRDKEMPKVLKKCLKKSLVDYGINPKRISFKYGIENYEFNSPLPYWELKNKFFSLKNNPEETIPGSIAFPKKELSWEDQKALSLLFAYLIDQKKTMIGSVIIDLHSLFGTTVEAISESLSYFCYHMMLTPFAIINLALQSKENTHLMLAYSSHKTFQTGNSDFIPENTYQFLSKIKRYWNCRKWLEQYNSLRTRLTLKKDPTQECVTQEELELWEKNNNYPLCLPFRTNEFNSLHPLDVFATQSFKKKLYTGNQDKLMYQFFTAIRKEVPVFEYVATHNSSYFLRKLEPQACNFGYLMQTYGQLALNEALNLTNDYAARKGIKFIILQKFPT